MPPLASAASRAALKRTVAAHRAIYDALAARDGEAAGELHLDAHRLRVGREEEDDSDPLDNC